MSENIEGNKINIISNKENPLDTSGENLEYIFELDDQGKINNIFVSNGTYCVSTNKDYTKLVKDDISDKCSYEELHNVAGTLANNFYEKSGRNDRGLVSSIEFFSDGIPKEGAISVTDVSEAQDGSIKMYIMQSDENSSLLDLKIVAKGKIAFPVDSSQLFAFYYYFVCSGPQSNLKEILFNDSIDTARTTNMQQMFKYDYKLEVLDLSSFDTSSVTNMNGMFQNINVDILDVSSFNTSNVTNMSNMFAYSQTTEIKGLTSFNTSKVTNMSSMFYYSHANSLNVSSFNTSNVTTMSSMFKSCSAKEIKGLTNFNTNNVTSTESMFEFAQAKMLDLSNFNTSKVTTMHRMFRGSQATEIKGLTNFNTSKVTNMESMFEYSKITILDLSSFNTSNVASSKMEYMFKNSAATTGYARTQAEANKFNATSNKPSGLKFVVK